MDISENPKHQITVALAFTVIAFLITFLLDNHTNAGKTITSIIAVSLIIPTLISTAISKYYIALLIAITNPLIICIIHATLPTRGEQKLEAFLFLGLVAANLAVFLLTLISKYLYTLASKSLNKCQQQDC